MTAKIDLKIDSENYWYAVEIKKLCNQVIDLHCSIEENAPLTISNKNDKKKLQINIVVPNILRFSFQTVRHIEASQICIVTATQA